MAKPKLSLEAFAHAGANDQAALTPVGETAPAPSMRAPAPAPTTATRRDRPHTTLYLDKKTQRTIKEIALQYDRKVHDLYLEGINLMLAQYGKPPIVGQGRK